MKKTQHFSVRQKRAAAQMIKLLHLLKVHAITKAEAQALIATGWPDDHLLEENFAAVTNILVGTDEIAFQHDTGNGSAALTLLQRNPPAMLFNSFAEPKQPAGFSPYKTTKA